ncbi:hypothetical protein HIM_09475 [Hirsutella minnesotensis 3608]|uniref:Uncharacterized protein n=1 Tax=Hirsutella minnesotensis 3608 TaxID=1043627 RepID=A0A0F7ZGL9_9HYPO|nr:hypothetical protein HIM_09475 [Hirsutella minnesotensis 3608]
MATATAQPPDCGVAPRFGGKISRVHSHHSLKSSRGQPLDPNDLTRRLHLLLVEQTGQTSSGKSGTIASVSKTDVQPESEAREQTDFARSRPEAQFDVKGSQLQKVKFHLAPSRKPAESGNHSDDPAQSCSYRHVPQVAASQFAVTTTVDGCVDRRLVHKLSRKALKFHLKGPNASPEIASVNPDAAPFEQTQALRRVQSHRERQYERNQGHYVPTLAPMTETDDCRISFGHRCTFGHSIGPRIGVRDGQVDLDRRRSTGGILSKLEIPPQDIWSLPASPVPPIKRHGGDICDPSEHRPVDWSQSDELCNHTAPSTATRPGLKKAESRWALRDRLGSLVKLGKEESIPSPTQKRADLQDASKSLRSSLFARFRR